MFLIFKIISVIRKISSVRAGLGLHTFGGTYSNCEGGVEVFSSSHRVILNGMFSFQTIFNFLCTLFYSHYATHCSPRLLRVYCWVQRCHKCDEFKQKHKSQREERKKGWLRVLKRRHIHLWMEYTYGNLNNKKHHILLNNKKVLLGGGKSGIVV